VTLVIRLHCRHSLGLVQRSSQIVHYHKYSVLRAFQLCTGSQRRHSRGALPNIITSLASEQAKHLPRSQPIPIILCYPQALVHRHRPVSPRFQAREHVLRQIVHRLVVDVMPNFQKAIRCRITPLQRSVPNRLTILNQTRIIIRAIPRIQVRIHNTIPPASPSPPHKPHSTHYTAAESMSETYPPAPSQIAS